MVRHRWSQSGGYRSHAVTPQPQKVTIMANHASPTSRRKGLFMLLTGVAASAILALSFSPTMSAFVASITNSVDTAASGYLAMQETTGTSPSVVTCNSTDNQTINTTTAATCSTINKYGGSTTMYPGQSVTTTISIKNTGTVAATAFTLTPGDCTQSNNGSVSGSATGTTGICSKMNVSIKSGSNNVYPSTGTSGSLNALKTAGPINLAAISGIGSVAPGASVSFTFVVTLDSSADNTYQGLLASQPLTWAFSS